MSDQLRMERALALAELGWGQTAPNPMVGAVVVAGDEIVGEGYHARYGDAHAEVNALEAAGSRAHGGTIFVTLEPCAHSGKTPPCVDAILKAGIARVVIAVSDPSEVAAGGAERLRGASIDVKLGVLSEAATELNAPFFNAHGSDRPWVTLKLALSADGRIADPTGSHRWITGAESRVYVHRLRANSDAIAVGVGTVIADDPALTVRGFRTRVAPRRVVFDSTGRTPLDALLVRTARDIETLIVAAGKPPLPNAEFAALEAAGVAVLPAATLREALAALRRRNVRSLFVEGGARLAGSLIADGLVDRLIIFRSTLRLGAEALPAFGSAPAGFEESLDGRRVVDQRRFGDDTMTIYALRDVPCSPD